MALILQMLGHMESFTGPWPVFEISPQFSNIEFWQDIKMTIIGMHLQLNQNALYL